MNESIDPLNEWIDPLNESHATTTTTTAQVTSTKKSFPRRISHVLVHVIVTDTNDNAPVFLDTPYRALIPADARKGDVVFKVCSKFSGFILL